jgi:hypothetical protein
MVERKTENYIKSFARRNYLSLAEPRERFFSETHETFLDYNIGSIVGSSGPGHAEVYTNVIPSRHT